MAALPLKMNNFSAVGAGQTANLQLATGSFYQELYLETDALAADLKVTLTLNSIKLFELTGTELNMLSDYYGIAKTAGYFSLPISSSHTPELGRRIQTGLNTFGSDNLVMDVEIKTGSQLSRLECFAEVRENSGSRGFVRRFHTFSQQVSAAGEVDFTNMDKKIRIMAAHFASPDMAGLKIERDKRILFELSKGRNNFVLKREKRMPQTGYFHFDPTRGNHPVAEAMITQSQDLNFKLEMSAGGQIVRILVDCLDTDSKLVVMPTQQDAKRAAKAVRKMRR
jgi:hypothetical protein